MQCIGMRKGFIKNVENGGAAWSERGKITSRSGCAMAYRQFTLNRTYVYSPSLRNQYNSSQAVSRLTPYVIRLLSILPLRFLYGLAWLSYVLLFYVLVTRRRLALQNLKAAFPGRSASEHLQLAKKHYKNMCMVIAEIIKSPGLSKQQLKQRVAFKNAEILERYLSDNQSVIIVTAHHCNPEWALLACTQHFNYPVDVIYRTQRIPWLEKFFYELRTNFGITPLTKKDCIMESVKRAKITRIVTLAADQSPRRSDALYWQTFLHRETAFHTGTEKIARAFKYPLVFMSMKRKRKGYYEAAFKLLVAPPYSGQPIMQKYVNELEALINASPEDWLWTYRRWKIKRPIYG